MATIEEIKKLRDATGVSIMQCRVALEKSGGSFDDAVRFLAAESAAIARKKSGRALNSGIVGSYVHNGGSMAALVELRCETDFVAKNSDFAQLASELAMHVAAMDPQTREELFAQSYVKYPDRTVDDIVKGAIQKFGENMEIGQFSRVSI